ncbi:hypothetical protein I4U23_005876 [Adineta vaga]|nr:hypothetical protein I4U23_005876 [Adineta vaga]
MHSKRVNKQQDPLFCLALLPLCLSIGSFLFLNSAIISYIEERHNEKIYLNTTNRVALNDNDSLFFNLRYFEQVYGKKLTSTVGVKIILTPTVLISIQQDPTPSNFNVQIIVNFDYMVICHELAHNKTQELNQEFIELMKTIAIK